MESPVPRTTGFKSYVSKARGLIRDFNNLPWVAPGRVTVEYDSRNAVTQTRSPSRPLVLWEKNPRLHHITGHSPQVDFRAGESPRNIDRHSAAASSALVSPPYVNEHGQQWPAIVPVQYDSTPLSEEGSSSFDSEAWSGVAYSPNRATMASPPDSEPITSTPPHANGALLPMPPPSPQFSPDGRWNDANRTGGLPPPPRLNYRTPSPAAPVALDTRTPSSGTGHIQGEMVLLASPITVEPNQPPPILPIEPVRGRVPTPGIGRSSPFRSFSPFFRSRPSTPSGTPPVDVEPHTPGRRSVLRRQRVPTLVAPNPRSYVGQTPRWLTNLISGRRSSRHGRLDSVDHMAENQSEASDRSRSSSALRASWVGIEHGDADGSGDYESGSDDEETEEGSDSQVDVDAPITWDIEFEADGVSGLSTPSPFIPALSSPSAGALRRPREDSFFNSPNATSGNPYVPLATRQPYGSPSSSPPDRVRSPRRPGMYGSEGVPPSRFPSDVPVMLASSSGLHNDPTQSRIPPYLSSNHPYSGYVSSQPPVLGMYGSALHIGHDGYVSSTIRLDATTETHSRSMSTAGAAFGEGRNGGSGTGRTRWWPPPEPHPVHSRAAYHPGFAYPAYSGPPFYRYPNYSYRPPMS
ncbi:hypothetical protein PQX77_003081 [Marasmius sp. AFHP31]|nr:hypothetical protein PQX77_003081 [Marasmius sp. AFHP31]